MKIRCCKPSSRFDPIRYFRRLQSYHFSSEICERFEMIPVLTLVKILERPPCVHLECLRYLTIIGLISLMKCRFSN